MKALSIVARASGFVHDVEAGTPTGTFSPIVVEKLH